MRSGALPIAPSAVRDSGERKGRVGWFGGLRSWATRLYSMPSSSTSQTIRWDCEFWVGLAASSRGGVEG